MVPVYHKYPHPSGRRPRAAWRYKSLLLVALLTFCVVQVGSRAPPPR